MSETNAYARGFVPYALAAFLIGLIGGFSSVLGPSFVQDLGLAYNNTTWTALAQAISTAACAPLLGRLADFFGRRRTLLLGLAVFALGNALSALANSLRFMLLTRFTVGLGTAAMTPVILSYIVSEFPKDKTAKGFSVYMLVSGASVVFGPTLGALLVSARGWRAMQWLCAGLCALGLILCLFLGRKERDKKRPAEKIDAAGAVFVPLFFGLVLCLVSFGQNFGVRSAPFLAVLAATPAALAGLIFSQRRAKHPILPGSLLRRRSFLLSVLALFLTQGVLQANMTNTIVFVNHTMPGNLSVSGYAVSVMYLALSLGAIVLGPIADRVSQKGVLVCAAALVGAGCAAMLLFSRETPTALLMLSLGLVGFGLGACGTVFLKVALSGLPAREAGAGAGTYGLFRDLAAPFGVAVLVPLFTNRVGALQMLGRSEADAALGAIGTLAIVEILCVLGGIAAILCLPKEQRKGEAPCD